MNDHYAAVLADLVAQRERIDTAIGAIKALRPADCAGNGLHISNIEDEGSPPQPFASRIEIPTDPVLLEAQANRLLDSGLSQNEVARELKLTEQQITTIFKGETMNERPNGQTPIATAVAEAPEPALGDAITAHAMALIKANTRPDGMLAINPSQMWCDLELAQVRIELLFEALVEAAGIDPKEMVQKLRDKLLAEIAQLEAESPPQIAIPAGRLPRSR